MSENIFADTAEIYWRAGLSIIPLRPKSKIPAINGWQRYQSRQATREELDGWIRDFPNANIGMTLGPASGLIAFDIDTDDPAMISVLEKTMPSSPWERIGAKGKVWVYKFDGGRTFRVNVAGKRIIDVLSAGTQIVLPPSIHPDTGKPYWSNVDLTTVLDRIVPIPPQLDQMLRDAFSQAGFDVASHKNTVGALTDFVSLGNRDNKMTSIAGMLSHDILKGNITLKEAMERMYTWADEFTKKVHGDSVDPKKGVAKLIEFLDKDVRTRGRALPKGWDDGLSEEDRRSINMDFYGEDDLKWSAHEIAQKFTEEVQKDGVLESDMAMTSVVQSALTKLARNMDIAPIEEDQLLRTISDITGKKLSVGSLRRQLRTLRAGPCRGETHSDVAKAVLADLTERDGEIRFASGHLWQWNGSHWAKMDEQLVRKYAGENYTNLQATRRTTDFFQIVNDIKDRTAKPLTDKPDISGINFVNGFLTEDLQLVPHHPDFGMTYTLPYPYEPDKAGQCHKWLEMLSDYWGEDEDYADKVEALREAICVTMFARAPKAQMAFVLYGVAHSGKSRILEIVRSLMPEDCVSAVTPSAFSDKFAPAEMVGKLLNIAGELSESSYIDGARFKQVVEGAEISAQRKNQPLFVFRPKCAQWFATNHLPRSKDTSEGFTRRFLIFEFPRKFPVARRIDDYDKLVVAEERTAIAAWAVQGLRTIKLNMGRLTDPTSSIRIREQLENQLNSVRSFLSDLQKQGRLLLGVEANGSATILDTLWTEFRTYCVANGVSPVALKTFESRMEQLQGVFGFQVERAGSESGLKLPQYRSVMIVRNKPGVAAAAA